MSDMFPASKDTPVMTAPAILEWITGEIVDVEDAKAQSSDPLTRGILAAISSHLQGMSARFTETTMQAMDGDTTAGRRQNQTGENP